jgi:cytochrome c oxidase cbb3-type subunit 3
MRDEMNGGRWAVGGRREPRPRTARAYRLPLTASQLLGAIALLAAATACEREARRFREVPPSANGYDVVVEDRDLQPGGKTPDRTVSSPYEHNAYAISEGKRLYEQWNCSGCHSHGGGGMGPPLMDDEWIYGSEPENIVETIVEGRPNGMPSFRGRIPNQQLWQIAAYVRSMSGLLPKDVTNARDDHMQYKRQEQTEKSSQPSHSIQAPPGAVMP